VTSAGATVYKLGQKIRPDAADPALVMHTTLYLSAAEYDVIASLPALACTRSDAPSRTETMR